MAGFCQPGPVQGVIAMVAHPSITLFVDLSEGGGIVQDSEGGRAHGSSVAGLAPGDLRLGGRCAGAVECLQIRLPPPLAVAVLGATADLGGAVVPLADVWGRDAERTEARLRAAGTWDERFAIAADTLGRRLEARRRPDPEVVAAWELILADRGRVGVDSLADEVGWSRKRLWSRFRSQLGLAPKHAARLVRFDHAARLLAAGRPAAAVAASTGYADQAHLHREVKAFTGMTPTAVGAAPWLAIDDVAWPAPPVAPPGRFGRGHRPARSRPPRP
ncbi:helix-turn-helix domain-containing protein [Streptomyces californicus]|uniref:helix-turn-helix domain-containing protein n=1 Tax=Streptomyces californicus TaxID=67351 RepID=UPI0037A5226C